MSIPYLTLRLSPTRPFTSPGFIAGLVFIVILLVGCAETVPLPAEIAVGHTRQEVQQILGVPDQRFELFLPEGPFFGPQESLINIIPAGSTVEEWQYKENGDIRYVWFWGESATEEWLVVMTLTSPEDAVY